jgi:hypothetical protein
MVGGGVMVLSMDGWSIVGDCHVRSTTKEMMRNKSRFHLFRWYYVLYSFPEALQAMLMPSHRLHNILANDLVFLLACPSSIEIFC